MAVTSRSPIIGVKNVKYALVTGGDTDTSTVPTYGTVKDLFATAQLGVDPAFSQTTGYYNDSPLYVFSSHGEMSFTLEGDDVFPDNKAELLGMSIANGILVDNVADTPPYAAIGGIITRADGSTEYFWMPKVQFAKGAITVSTKGSSVTPQNDVMNGRVVATVYNGSWRTRIRSNDGSINATTFSNWFNQPVLTSGADLNALSVALSAGTAGKIVCTFTKAGGGNVTINAATLVAPNILFSIDSTGALVTPTVVMSGQGTASAVATFSGFTAVKHDIVVTSGVKDQNSVGCTNKAGSVTVT